MNSPKFSYYFTVFPTLLGGKEMDTFLFVDHEAVLREEAVHALDPDADVSMSKKLAHSLECMKLRVRNNSLGTPLLQVSTDELMTREDLEAFVAATPMEELLQMKAKDG